MTDYSQFSKPFLRTIIEETAARLGLPSTSVEKDWWVCLILEALYSDSALSQRLTFKGGTSLSKAFRLIHRFSEDIDIVIDRRSLGFAGERNPENAPSNSARKKLMLELKSTCAAFIHDQIMPFLRSRLEESRLLFQWSVVPDEHDHDKQTLLVNYESLFSSASKTYIEPRVRIELGARSGDEPTQIREIRSMISEVFHERSWAHGFEVTALDPVRTFLEKICLIHEENHRPPNNPIKARMSRHLYDACCLYDAGIGAKAFSDHDLLNRVVQHRKTYFFYSWMNYETMKPGSFMLVPSEDRIDFWRLDYDKLQSEMIYGEAPAFSELLKKLEHIQHSANADNI
ncbi:MAG: nucleotidyl transferase AbiEii/AbiGii toxin family protein [Rectinema subterraneum]|uniref:nucleotidyl transferase AbiEii/AbiGii toxin family protein n=1 Tax=Rectinema subterraneum TaxID=2653714 RepID=UPI003C7CA161